MADGSITYSTKLDNADLEKDLAAANKKVERLEAQIQKSSNKRLPIAKQVADLGAQLDAAKAKLAALQDESQRVATALSGSNINDPASISAYTDAAARQAGVTKELSSQQKVVDSLQQKFDRAADRMDAIDAETKRLNEELATAKDRAGTLATELAKPASASAQASAAMGKAVDRAQKSVQRFGMRLREVMRSALIFTLISQGFAALRKTMGNLISTNREASTALAQLRAALYTLAQPILQVIIPAFTAFLNILTRIVTAIAGFLSMLFGGTIEQSKDAAEGLYDEAAAIEATGSAAKGASKSLASFDQINKLSSNASSAGGGGAAATAPDFSFDTSNMEQDFDKLLNWIKLIGAALLAWKLSDSFLGGLKMFVGLLVAITGAIELVKGAWDAWQNGVNLDNFLQMLSGGAMLAAGLGIAFGKVGAAIGLIVSGLTMFVTGIQDALKVGWTFENMLTTVSGLLMGGLGISLLTGSWIPLLVAAIASLLLVFTNAFGQGQLMLDGIKTLLQGFLDFFKGIFTMDLSLTLQGLQLMIQGLQMIIQSILLALQNAINSFLTWLDEITQGKISGLIEWIRSFVNDFIATILQVLDGLASSITQILSGVITFISGVFTADWTRAWNGITEVFRGIWNTIVTLLEGGINFIIDGINAFIRAVNAAFDVIRSLLGFPPPISEIAPVKLPRLAKGAVIPPNREFLAVLGDQKSGTNIETPLATMVQAFKQALSEGGYGGNSEAYLVLDGEVLGKIVYRLNKAESNRVGVNLVEE